MSLPLPLRQQIGQHFVFGFHGHELNDDIRTLIRDYHVGNVILMKRNVRDAAQVHALVHALQATARAAGHARPLLIGTDQENGLVSAFSAPSAGTQFPGAMALAATGSPALAEEVAAATARELRLAGITWAYSPVADVNSDARNPVIGVRSYGDDPAEVARYATAVARGLAAGGVAACAKHYPGHGATHVDSHIALPTIAKARAALERTELPPFAALVSAGVPSVMTGHMAVPALTGGDAPCSLAPAVGALLRARGFAGVVVTDCLEMDAVRALCGVAEGAARALEAGADVAMACHTMAAQVGAVEAVCERVGRGTLSLEALEASGARVAALKDRIVGGWDAVLGAFDATAWARAKEEHAALSARAYGAAVAVVRDAGLPVRGPTVLFTPVLQPMNAAVDNRRDVGAGFAALAAAIRRRTEAEHVVYGPETTLDDAAEAAVRAAGSVVFVTRNAEQAAWQVKWLRRVQALAATAVVVGSCGPYDAAVTEGGYVATFEYTPAALEAACSVLFGEQPARGRVPVVTT